MTFTGFYWIIGISMALVGAYTNEISSLVIGLYFLIASRTEEIQDLLEEQKANSTLPKE